MPGSQLFVGFVICHLLIGFSAESSCPQSMYCHFKPCSLGGQNGFCVRPNNECWCALPPAGLEYLRTFPREMAMKIISQDINKKAGRKMIH